MKSKINPIYIINIIINIVINIVYYLGRKLYVPPSNVNEVISHFHSGSANKHQGWCRTFNLIKEKHAGISEAEVRHFVNNCDVCIKYNTVTKKPRLKPILSCG
jgi:hypothetical protein